MSEQTYVLTEPGLYPKLPAEAYHADCAPEPSLSNSIANLLLARSPRHAWHAHPKLNPYFRHDKPSNEMDIGTVAHSMLLEGSQRDVVIVEASDWRTKDAQTKRDAARADGRTAILQRHFFAVKEMVDAAKEQIEHSELRGMLKHGDAELTGLWLDGPAWCRMRIDWASHERDVLVDYKTCENAEPNAFLRQILNMGYDLQAAFYSRGAEVLTGKAPKFVFLAQEKDPPYLISLTSLDPAWMEFAQTKVLGALAIWNECMHANAWPAYPRRICYGQAPAWAETQWLEREEQAIDYGSQA